MSGIESTPDKSRARPWGSGRRLALSVPIFIILIGLLVTISNLTTVPWDNEPTGQTIATLSSDTAVTFDNPSGETLPAKGSYDTVETHTTIDATRPSTGEVERLNVIIRAPKAADGGRHPGVVFMHGAGYATAAESFVDVAEAMASAGFVTAVIDKPVWSTNDVTRDYPASALAYDQTINLLRGRDDVDPAKVGIYAISESTWISGYLLRDDPDVAFQILLSPMVYSPRRALGFFVSQDFALVGAHEGYQSIVRRLFSIDAGFLGFDNFDISVLEPETYSVPTFIAYGSKDVMTAQVEGTWAMLHQAHRAGNWDVTIRSYPIANHVLGLGDEADSDTPHADGYLDDMIDWTVGTAQGLEQTSERVAGTTIYQSIAVPRHLKANRVGTIYGVALHALMIVLLLVTGVLWLVALGRLVRGRLAARRMPRRCRTERTGKGGAIRPVLGFQHGFGGVLVTLTIATFSTLVVFAAGLGQVIMGVVHLAWGMAPSEEPGVMWWSWPFIQIVCTLVVWAWSRVLARVVEVAAGRGLVAWPPRRGTIKRIVTEPVLASTRLGRSLFWLTALAMGSVLLVFAFWGLFVY